MRPDEKYAFEALIEKYGGRFTKGEDPPDGYIVNNGKKYAVEVTRLIQYVTDDNGIFKPRIAADLPAHRLVDEIDLQLRSKIPLGRYVFMILYTPVNDVRKTKKGIISKILEMLASGREKEETRICSNSVSIFICNGDQESGKKVVAALPNSHSSPYIEANVDYLLQNRIRAKNSKRKALSDIDEYWLALINEYWIADEKSYQRSFETLNIEHRFDKIVLIDHRKQCHEIYSKT